MELCDSLIYAFSLKHFHFTANPLSILSNFRAISYNTEEALKFRSCV